MQKLTFINTVCIICSFISIYMAGCTFGCARTHRKLDYLFYTYRDLVRKLENKIQGSENNA